MPIARLIITEAAIRIGRAFARVVVIVVAVMAGTFPLARQPARIGLGVNSIGHACVAGRSPLLGVMSVRFGTGALRFHDNAKSRCGRRARRWRRATPGRPGSELSPARWLTCTDAIDCRSRRQDGAALD